jgi:antitoxin (DNA-binding transcriptional repressor) of toxin-antitoxin stability system
MYHMKRAKPDFLGRMRKNWGDKILEPSNAELLAEDRNFAVPCDAKMYHMKRATVRDLRYAFKEVEAHLAEGEEIEIVKRNKVIAKLVPVDAAAPVEKPDFLARMRKIHGDVILRPSNAELLALERERF